MPNPSLNNSKLEEIEIEDIDRAYILRSPHLERILFSRNVIGLDFTNACEGASIDFFTHLKAEISDYQYDIAELVILSKGVYYWLHNAYRQVFSRNLQANFIATNRTQVVADTATVNVGYANLDAPASTLVIGDTIASGQTICNALSEYMARWPVKRVFIFTIVGSKVGGQAIGKFCGKNQIDLTIVYGLAAFGLAQNGFDLSFLDPATITSVEYINRAKDAFYGKPISSAGWDFGTQAQAIKKYRMLSWIESRYWGLENSDVFQEVEPPYDQTLIEKERSAFHEVIPDLSAILPPPG